MIYNTFFLLSLLLSFPLMAAGNEPISPQYLYKIVSIENWDRSREEGRIVLPAEDNKFIHLAKKDQLDRILNKYWDNVNEFVILKVKTSELKGDLVYEANPGGENRYYHLYNGSIPLEAVQQVKFFNRGYKSPLVPKDF